MGIWSEGAWQDTPIEEAVIENVELNQEGEFVKIEEKPVETGFKGLPVRCGGDTIWLIKEGKKHRISSAEVYSKLGFKFGDEKDLDFETLMVLKEGEPIK
ncbi:hypothetical protein M0R04_10610 [Candidatus Dojkabacteria bacterium]|jgi:hypothetical protein|nr:hypothetical protein [Candidatus Dojkabacteria bacterium]